MQTFLPYKDFTQTAKCLDYRRLGKQRLEAIQIYKAITTGSGWANHPATKMWSGYQEALKLYTNCIIDEWIRRGYKNSIPKYEISNEELIMPWWIGREEFHASHRAALLAKDFEYYSQFKWLEQPKIEYVWNR